MSTSEEGKNLEAGVSTRPEGYDKLGSLMGGAPETAIFRRFGALSAEDLLYRQAELVGLEERLRRQQKKDKESEHKDRERYALNWDKLERSGDEDVPEGNDATQLETIYEIRDKLKDYHKALLRHRRVLDLGAPISGHVRDLNNWMQTMSRGNVYLEGLDRNIWSEPNLDDMVALAPRSTESRFTGELAVKLIGFYNKVIGRRIHKTETKEFMQNTIRYSDEGLFRVMKTLFTIVACLLPVASIAVVYAIQTVPARLGAIAGFIALFSFTLSLIPSASLNHIFSATAAFAAVLVVFVGTTEPAR